MDPHTTIGFPDQAIQLAADRRRRHMAIIGATGSGKTSLLLVAAQSYRARCGPIDEAQDIVTDIIPTLLSPARHYGGTLALATQCLAGLSEKTQAALRGNPETLVVFRPGAPDAELLAPEFNRLHQTFNPTALLQLPRGQAAVRIAGRSAPRSRTSCRHRPCARLGP